MSQSEPEAERCAAVFAALGDPTRLSLMWRLKDGDMLSVTALSEGLPLTRQGVSKHLRILEQAGVLTSRKVGRESRYAFQPDAVVAARSYLDAVSAQWDETIARLKRFVEE